MQIRLFGQISLGFVFLFQMAIGWAQPVAEFGAFTPTTQCAPQVLVVSFDNQTTNTGANPTYQWRTNTVPVQTSTLENPSFVYTQPGCYEVTLISTNGLGTDTITKACFVEIYAQPEPGFVVDPIEACVPTPIQFTDTSLANAPGGNVDWLWILSVNNLTSTLQNPNFTVTDPNDSIDVILRVRNSNGCENTVVFDNVVVTRERPVADFTVDVNSACNPPLTVNFTNTSDERGTTNLTYTWQFPNGVTTSGQSSFVGQTPPPVTYSTSGQFDVTLIISGIGTCDDTITYNNLIGIGGVTAEFNATDTVVCLGDPITFESTSSGGVSTIGWDFGELPGIDATSPLASYTYGNPGVYSVTLFANNVSCGDTLVRNSFITVLDTPTANFGIDRDLDCQPGNPFVFTDSSSGNNSWSWDFGDGNTSTAQNPTHTYTSFGTFPVTLTVENAVGCSKSFTDTVTIAPPTPGFSVSDREGCAPLMTMFTDASNSPVDPITSWQWTFPGGTPGTSNAQNPSVTYNNPGTFSVSLIISTGNGCSDTLTRSRLIRVGTPPVSTFTVDKDTVCIFEDLTFTADSSDSTWNYFWDFQYVSPGNFQQLTSAPATVYPDTGLFSVALVVEDNGCRDTTIVDDMVFVSPPRAEFTTSENLICSLPATITFSDSSIGPADIYTWFVNGQLLASFGGPQVPNPYTITTPGTYIFQQAILNSATGCTDTATVIVNAGNPIASFNITDTAGCRPYQVGLNNTSQNVDLTAPQGGYSFLRNGVPFRSTNSNGVSITFQDTGLIDVRLIVLDQFGCRDTAFEPQHIEVFGSYAGAIIDRTPACPNESIQFTDTSSAYRATISSQSWSFPTSSNPVGVNNTYSTSFSAAGFYNGSLAVQDSRGCTDSLALQVQITQPIANFMVVDTSTCSGADVPFVNQSQGIGNSYLWDFGDGDTSNLITPTNTYFGPDSINGNFFDVSLIATDINGCSDTIVRPNYIFIEPFDIRFFASDTLALCPPLSVQLFDTSIGTPVLWDWFFDGAGFALGVDSPQVGAFFQVPGLYDVLAIGTHEDGCRDTLLKEDYILVAGPSGTYEVFPDAVCEGDTVCITAEVFGAAQAVILFGDGGTQVFDTSTLTGFIDTIVVCHVYTDSGQYFPQIVLTDDQGCTFTPNIQDSALVYRRPQAAIFPQDTTGCSPLAVPFMDASIPGNGNLVNWNWDFGNGDSSLLQNPVYTYVGDTIYDVTLVIEDQFGCSDTATTTVNVFEGAVPEFFASDTTGCAPINISFTDSSFGAVPPSAWIWIFGDGSDTLRGVSPPVSHTYVDDGLFSVTLIISDNLGCSDTLTKVDYIDLFRPQPVVTASQTEGCNPISITFFSDSTVSRRPLETYEWCLVDINTNDTTCIVTNAPEDSLVLQFDDPGEYVMILSVTDSLSCPATSAPLPVSIQQRIVPDPIVLQNVTVESASTVEVNWDSYPGSDFVEYVVYRIDDSVPVEVGRTTDQINTRFVDMTPGLDPESGSICYKVTVINSCLQESDVNLTLEHCTIDLEVTPIIDGLVLDWTDYVGFPVATYEIYRANDYLPGSLQQIGQVDGNTLTYTDLETFCYDSISYRVRAVGVGNINQRSFSDLDGEAPIHLPPTEVSDVITATVVEDSFVRLSWLDYTGYLPQEYVLEKSLDGNSYSILNTFNIGTTSLDDENVAVDDFSYYYRVQVIDQCGDTANYGNLGKSILLNATLEGTTPVLNWSAYEEWELGVQSYRVEIFDEVLGDFVEVQDFLPADQTNFEDLLSDFPNQFQYCYRVVATEIQGNQAEAVSNEACVLLPPRVFIPNAFTPNNEGPDVNDVFTIYLPRVENAEVSIFNRWGQRVYHTFDWRQYWDGTFRGQPVQEGVYVYVITGNGFDGTQFSRTGTVTLIR
ncbi:MAG: PKD domain-containing protein [Bacteroidia bacterium]|nr:PKD domain-containing protein [Bacteroidia bacterium]